MGSIVSVTAGPSRQATPGVSGRISYTDDQTVPGETTGKRDAAQAYRLVRLDPQTAAVGESNGRVLARFKRWQVHLVRRGSPSGGGASVGASLEGFGKVVVQIEGSL